MIAFFDRLWQLGVDRKKAWVGRPTRNAWWMINPLHCTAMSHKFAIEKVICLSVRLSVFENFLSISVRWLLSSFNCLPLYSIFLSDCLLIFPSLYSYLRQLFRFILTFQSNFSFYVSFFFFPILANQMRRPLELELFFFQKISFKK